MGIALEHLLRNVNSVTLKELREFLQSLSKQDRWELDRILLAQTGIWVPLPGPQTQAYESRADFLLYGGAAGGGKTDLMIGKMLTQHFISIVFRREGTQLTGVIERLVGILGHKNGYNGMEKIWRMPWLDNRRVEFGACKNIGDEIKYQGRPHDFKGFDELPHFSESQFRFLSGWLRNADRPDVPMQVMGAGNPPTNAEGAWVKDFWGAWLDPKHHNPAKPGELRWYIREKDKDVEVESAEPVKLDGEDVLVVPKSRTFIPAKVEDNPYLMDSGYRATLQALPEPLRSQMLKGDFSAGVDDDVWQVIPTAWVEAAMQRWQPRSRDSKGSMDSLGVDPARGGRDEMVMVGRYERWFDMPVVIPGVAVPTGSQAAGQVIAVLTDRAVVHIDVVGIGASPYDHLNDTGIQIVPVNGADEATGTDRSGQLNFFNLRSQLYWQLREDLDPVHGKDYALPPDPKLKADLCAPRWRLQGRRIQVEPKEASPGNGGSNWGIKNRLGRSPDRGDAVVLANMQTRKRSLDNSRRESKNWRT